MANILPVDLSSDDDWDDEENGFEMVTSSGHSNTKTRNMHFQQVEPSDAELLRLAAIRGELEGVKDVLSKGSVKVDDYLQGDWTALMHAAAMGHSHVVEHLLDRGADPNFSKDRFTPLMATCASRHDGDGLVACARALLRHGARADACDRHRLTPLMYACKEGCEQLARELLPHSDLAAQDNQGWTALFWAVSQGHEKIVQLLLDHGIPQHLMDRRGQMAVDLAVMKHFEKISAVLGAVEDEIEPEEKDYDQNFRQSFQELLLEINDNSCTTLRKEVATILHGLGLKEFVQVFEEHRVDLLQFLTMTDDGLKELGLAPRYRKRILEAVELYHFKPWKKSSVHIKPQDEPFSVHDGVIALCGTLRHVDLLRAAVAYVKQRLESSNCRLDGDSQLASNLRYYAGHALRYSELLYRETLLLYRQAVDIEKYDKIIPADLIVERKRPAKSRKLSTVVMGVVIVVMVWFHIR